MKRGGDVRWSVTASLLLTAVLFVSPLAAGRPLELPQQEPEAERSTETQVPESAAPGGTWDAAQVLKVLDGDAVIEMDLGTYLTGVLRSEMPASFPREALKAQAVAARTYTLYKLQQGGSHGDTADVCTDFACCQAYMTGAEAAEVWGAEAVTYEARVADAVRQTDGQAILYGGDPILAVFHSSSAGLTRAAGEVWSGDLPYLQPVASPEAGDAIPNYYSRVEFSAAELREKVRGAYPEANLSGSPATWLTAAKRDAAGSVDTLRVGGVTVKGTQLRSLLGLRSACFTWEAQGESIVFYVTGYGHGVGLSQYGARAMAEAGKDYREILTHYYTGTVVEHLSR